MNVFSRYLIRHLFLGFAAAAGLLLPLFTTFNLINELDDVSPGGYRWTQAVLVVLMTLPRTLVELSPFIALLGGIVGLGQLSKNSELTAIRSTGFSIFRIALVALVAGILWTVSLGAIDEWVASPLQQQALQIKSTATALGEDDDITGNMLWARRGNEFVTVKSLNEQGQPVGVEIFHYRDDLRASKPKSNDLGFEARNLWIIKDHVPHIDPEANFFGPSQIGGGVEFNSIPSTRSFGFNLRLTL